MNKKSTQLVDYLRILFFRIQITSSSVNNLPISIMCSENVYHITIQYTTN